MAEVHGVQTVVNAIKHIAHKHLETPNAVKGESVIVGYSAGYALWVHESVDMVLKGKPRGKGRGNFWDPQGKAQAKYLETPARQLNNSGELGNIVSRVMKSGRGNLQTALYMAGLRLLRESQKLVPVDSGHLKSSGFVLKE